MDFSFGSVVPIFLIVGFAWLIWSYNRFIRRKNAMREAWSGIDVQLKRRHNLIPNLVKTVKAYAGHEQQTLDSLTELRAGVSDRNDVAKVASHENMLSRALGGIFAVSENYPDLKANSTFLELQQQLAETEEQVQLARRYYNGAVRDWNIMVESFPSNLIALGFRFHLAEFFEINLATERAVPQVNF